MPVASGAGKTSRGSLFCRFLRFLVFVGLFGVAAFGGALLAQQLSSVEIAHHGLVSQKVLAEPGSLRQTNPRESESSVQNGTLRKSLLLDGDHRTEQQTQSYAPLDKSRTSDPRETSSLLARLADYGSSRSAEMWAVMRHVEDHVEDEFLDKQAAVSRYAHLQGGLHAAMLLDPDGSELGFYGNPDLKREMLSWWRSKHSSVHYQAPESSAIVTAIEEGNEICARDVHVFYYMWYANAKVDGAWAHWNHEYLPHWDKKIAEQYPSGRHDPDKDDIGSVFWPQLGPYSSLDRAVIRAHLQQMSKASIGVVALSWYPPGRLDRGIHEHDELLLALLTEASGTGVEVAVHIEPYEGRTPKTVRADIKHLIEKYGDHPAMHKRLPVGRHGKWLSEAQRSRGMPMIYVYDSYHNQPVKWAELLTPGGSLSIRGTDVDAIVFCLWVEQGHGEYLAKGGFDGAYTYFAADGFSYGSTKKNWPAMAAFAAKHETLFSPSVGPGYNDVRVRPWNAQTTRPRRDGVYFDEMFAAALGSADLVGITSWNEWHEGTNIEPAIPKTSYEDYGPNGPESYLCIVRSWVQKWGKEHWQKAAAATPTKAPAQNPSSVSQGVVVYDSQDSSQIPVLIICAFRPLYLRRALDSVFKSRKQSNQFPITASQDGGQREVADLIQQELRAGSIARHLRFQEKEKVRGGGTYQRLAKHYRWALSQMFDVHGHEQVIILEEDLEIAPDFFSFFAATLPLLKRDKDLFCVSAWNDNGKPEIASDPRAIVRSDFFPGLGWMLLKGFWNEIRDRWPQAYWDDFIRHHDIRRGRQCLRPEVSRTHTFGEVGVSQGQFYQTHLAKMALNAEDIDWASEDLSAVATADNFDAWLSSRIRSARSVSLKELGQERSQGLELMVRYKDRDFGTLARHFGLMEDEKDGVRRGAYRGVIPITWKGNRVYLVCNWPFS